MSISSVDFISQVDEGDNVSMATRKDADEEGSLMTVGEAVNGCRLCVTAAREVAKRDTYTERQRMGDVSSVVRVIDVPGVDSAT